MIVVYSGMILGYEWQNAEYPLVSSNMASWKIPELNGGFNGKITYKNMVMFEPAMFDDTEGYMTMKRLDYRIGEFPWRKIILYFIRYVLSEQLVYMNSTCETLFDLTILQLWKKAQLQGLGMVVSGLVERNDGFDEFWGQDGGMDNQFDKVDPDYLAEFCPSIYIQCIYIYIWINIVIYI